MLGAGSLLTERDEIGLRHKENQEKRDNSRHDEASRNRLFDGGAKRKSSLQEIDTAQNSGRHSGKRNQAAQIASGDPEYHAERAAKKDQHPDHDEGSQEKADDGRGSSLDLHSRKASAAPKAPSTNPMISGLMYCAA